MKTLVIFMLYLKLNLGFQIVQKSISHPNGVQEGQTVTLRCQADSSYEYCFWKHNGRLCEFEWKYSSGKVEKQDCVGLHTKMKFTGDYETHDCSIELSNVSLDDTGIWTCDMESYVFGNPRGYKAKDTLELKVFQPTTTSRTTIALTSMTATQTSTGKIPTELATERPSKTTEKASTMASTTEKRSTTYESPVISDDAEFEEIEEENMTTESYEYSGDFEPELRIGDEDNSETNEAKISIIPIILGCLMVVFIVSALVIYVVFKRRQKGLVSLSGKVSMRALQKKNFVHDTSEEDLEEAVTGKNARPPSFVFLGAKAFDVKDDTLVRVSVDATN